MRDQPFVFIKTDRAVFFRAGGVELYAMQGKIILDNTIETRLARIFDQMLPEIRLKLFRINTQY